MILTRHGQTLFNLIFGATRADPGLADPILTAEGRAQAHALAHLMRARGVRRLITSPYRRALETTTIIARSTGLPVLVDARIRERAAYACDVGTPRSGLRREFAEFEFSAFGEIWWSEEEEAMAPFEHRCAAFRAEQAGLSDWSDVAVITHWGVIRSLTGLRVTTGEIVRYDPIDGVVIEHPHDTQ